MTGQTISHYRIVEKLGAGGMGEVYRAEDTKLDRQVAIKMLPDAFSSDPERLARFEREAKLLASLNHPNIAAIYGLEEADGKCFLVLELVEGQTLAQRILKGPLPVDEALDVCRQITEGLEAAHEKGIIHRDLKPANVMITADDNVKILDFGLAKARWTDSQQPEATHSPTITEAVTSAGVILGTAAYMSPEQAKGKVVDKRADIWACGCILYECLTGRRAFGGETVTETMAAILKSDPDYTLLPPETRAAFSHVLRKCLQKDPGLRLRDIADVRLELRDSVAAAVESGLPVTSRGTATRRWFLWGLTALAVAAVAVAVWLSLQPRPVPQLVRLNLEARITDLFSASPPFAVSPDGSCVVYVSEFQNEQVLFHRRLDQYEATPLPRTEDARAPFFSPDGQTVGYFSRGRLRRVPVSGGTPSAICEVPTDFGWGAWGPDDTIVFATWLTRGGLFRVPAVGGKPVILTSPRSDHGEIEHESPHFLPGGEHILFTVRRFPSYRTALLTLKTGKWETLDMPGNARYVTTGHLIYPDQGSLFARRLDLARLTPIGSPKVVVEGVYQMQGFSGSAYFEISDTGILVYVAAGTSRSNLELVWINKTGEVTPVPIEGEIVPTLRISPDGLTAALLKRVGTENAIFLQDLGRGGHRKLTSSRSAYGPVWFPDGQRIAFAGIDTSGTNLFWNRIDASEDAELLLASRFPKEATDISRDSHYLAYYEINPQTSRDIWILPLQGERRPAPFLATPANERSAVFSPDGHWLAYASDESGRDEVYVQPFPKGAKGARMVSTHGGREPVWSPDGKELYYRRRNQLIAVPVQMGSTFTPGLEQILFEGNFAEEIGGRNQSYSVSPDNRRFLIMRQGGGTTPQSLRVVLNWFEELKRLVPTGKK